MITQKWARFSRVVFFIYAFFCLCSNFFFLLSFLFHGHDIAYQIFRIGDYLTHFWIINPLPVIVSILGLIRSVCDNSDPESKNLQRKYRRSLFIHLIASTLIWMLSGITLVAFTGGV